MRDTTFPQYVFWEKIRNVLKKSTNFLGLRNSILRHRDPYFGDQNWSFFEKVVKKWNPTGTASFSEIVTCGDVWWNSSGSNEFYCKFPGLGYTQNSLLATKPNPNVLPVGTMFVSSRFAPWLRKVDLVYEVYACRSVLRSRNSRKTIIWKTFPDFKAPGQDLEETGQKVVRKLLQYPFSLENCQLQMVISFSFVNRFW